MYISDHNPIIPTDQLLNLDSKTKLLIPFSWLTLWILQSLKSTLLEYFTTDHTEDTNKFALSSKFFFENANKSGKLLAGMFRGNSAGMMVHSIHDSKAYHKTEEIASQFVKYYKQLYKLGSTNRATQSPFDHQCLLQGYLKRHSMPSIIAIITVISAWLTWGESLRWSPGCLSLCHASMMLEGDLVTMPGLDPQPSQVHSPCPSTIVQLPHWCLRSFPSCFTLTSLRR